MSIFNDYIDYLEGIKGYADNTSISYNYDIKEYEHYLLKNKIAYEKISYLEARDYLKYLNARDSKATISRKISSIRSFYKYLELKGIVENNVFKRLKKPKLEKKVPRFFYYNEIEELLSVPNLNTSLGQRDKLILEILYASGVRVSELVNIKVNDIQNNVIKVRGKGDKDRIVFIGEYALEALNTYLKDAYLHLNKYKYDHLFLNARGKPITPRGVQYILDKIIEETSIQKKISPHMLRHSFATHLLNEGCDIVSVQELMGHESLSSTEVYTHVTNDRIREVYFKSFPRAK